MGIFSKLVGGGIGQIAEPIEAIGNIIDSVHTSEDEKLNKQELIERLRQNPQKWQAQVNMLEAQHRTMFVAGWRPAIGWTCAVALFVFYVPQFLVATYVWTVASLQVLDEAQTVQDMLMLPAYPASDARIMELVLAMLGVAGLRQYGKLKGTDK